MSRIIPWMLIVETQKPVSLRAQLAASCIRTEDGDVPAFIQTTEGCVIDGATADGTSPPAWMVELAEYLEDVCGYRAGIIREPEVTR